MANIPEGPWVAFGEAEWPYSTCRLKPIVSVDAGRKHFSDPIVRYGCSSIITKQRWHPCQWDQDIFHHGCDLVPAMGVRSRVRNLTRRRLNPCALNTE